MKKIISIVNQKGGVGKTTTAINLASCLAEKGERVLLIDLDSQGNSTAGVGITKNELDITILDLLLYRNTVEQCIKLTDIKNLHIIPSDINLSKIENNLFNYEDREYILSNLFEMYLNEYDYFVIDCPPAINILTLNALTFCNSLLIPVQCEFYAFEGLTQLLSTIKEVKKYFNQKLKIEGIVCTMYDSRTNLSRKVVEKIDSMFDDSVHKTIIPRNIRLAEAPSHGIPINIYDPDSKGSIAYKLLATQVIRKK